MLLHGESELAGGGELSDVDLALPVPMSEHYLRRVVYGALADLGVRPVLSWRYDRASYNFCFVAGSPRDGAQIDIDADPTGVGKYGLRTAEAYVNAVDGRYGKVLAPDDQHIYLLSKRLMKQQVDRVQALVAVDPATTDRLSLRANALLAPHAARRVQAALRGDEPNDVGERRPASSLRRVANLGRVADRALAPVGFWVVLESADVDAAMAIAATVVREFAVLLPHARVLPLSRLGNRWQLAGGAAVHRRRPTLAVSAKSPGTLLGSPDLTIACDARDRDEIVREISRSMADQTERRLLRS